MQCVVCDEHINPFEYNWLADLIPGCCRSCGEIVHERRQQKFREHLDHASQIVASWPKWKQEVLGWAVRDENT